MKYIQFDKVLLIFAILMLLSFVLLMQANGVLASAQTNWEPDLATQAALDSLTTTQSDVPLDYPEPPEEFFNPISTNTSESASLINLDDFRTDARFSGIDGSNVAVVVLDTGIDLDHSFFGSDLDFDNVSDRIVYQYDFADDDTDASDVNGHGSNVTSIVASSDGTYTGVAPDVDIIHLKVFPDSGGGTFSDVESALQWVVANAATYNVVSVNMSLGDSANHSSAQALYGISDEISALVGLEVVVISASGNDFYTHSSVQGVGYPAADLNSFSIGAVFDSNVGGFTYGSGAENFSSAADVITPFTQRHSTLSTFFAPGAPITGAGPTGGLVSMHGTSQAAPHVAGMVALMQELAIQELGRQLTVAEVESIMSSTAVTINDGDDENDNVTNTSLDFLRVDMFAIGEAILAMADPAPTVASISTDEDTGDDSLDDGEATNVDVTKLHITYSEEMIDPIGNSATDDVTNPANYQLIADGSNDSFETAVCGAVQGDDTTIVVDSVTFNSGTFSATLSINSGTPLVQDSYRLFVCAEIEDTTDNQLDGNGDGTAGDDFFLDFGIDTTAPVGEDISFESFSDPDNTPSLSTIDIQFPEPMQYSGGTSSRGELSNVMFSGSAGDVTNSSNYMLVRSGANETIDTTACGIAQGDDQSVSVDSVSYDSNANRVTLTVNAGHPLPNDSYYLIVCGTIEDSAGNPMGTDFGVSFTVTMSYSYLPLVIR
ncbi:MAG: S8 family serine peptidase [Chloroflexota bacterium]